MVTTLFLDIGGVLGTNGWDTAARQRASAKFDLSFAVYNDRHKRIFDAYETGHLTLDEYLRQSVFNVPRNFTPVQFKEFMFAQSQPFPEVIDYFREIKEAHQLKVYSVNNEGLELNEYRLPHFGLHELLDAAVSSCYVGLRKPDARLYQLALNLAQRPPSETVVIDDRPQFVEVAHDLGLHAIRHVDLATTRTHLQQLLSGSAV